MQLLHNLWWKPIEGHASRQLSVFWPWSYAHGQPGVLARSTCFASATLSGWVAVLHIFVPIPAKCATGAVSRWPHIHGVARYMDFRTHNHTWKTINKTSASINEKCVTSVFTLRWPDESKEGRGKRGRDFARASTPPLSHGNWPKQMDLCVSLSWLTTLVASFHASEGSYAKTLFTGILSDCCIFWRSIAPVILKSSMSGLPETPSTFTFRMRICGQMKNSWQSCGSRTTKSSSATCTGGLAIAKLGNQLHNTNNHVMTCLNGFPRICGLLFALSATVLAPTTEAETLVTARHDRGEVEGCLWPYYIYIYIYLLYIYILLYIHVYGGFLKWGIPESPWVSILTWSNDLDDLADSRKPWETSMVVLLLQLNDSPSFWEQLWLCS